MRIRFVMAFMACLGCSGRGAIPPESVQASTSRCNAVADSVRAGRALEQLPLAQPLGGPRLPDPPHNAPAGIAVGATFLVRPDGMGDTASVAVIGTEEPSYRQAVVAMVSTAQFQPAFVAGCPVWSRGLFHTIPESR